MTQFLPQDPISEGLASFKTLSQFTFFCWPLLFFNKSIATPILFSNCRERGYSFKIMKSWVPQAVEQTPLTIMLGFQVIRIVCDRARN